MITDMELEIEGGEQKIKPPETASRANQMMFVVT